MLQQIDYLPPQLLTAHSTELYQFLAGPTLIHLTGLRNPPLFVSILLHGNEDVGLRAIQSVLQKYTDRPLPRSLNLFIGNIDAAKAGVRFLDGQVDYNRIWPGTKLPWSVEQDMMRVVVREVTRSGIFASIDLHNNTGRNPIYGGVCATDNKQLQLASMFSRTALYFLRPTGVQTQAFAAICPSLTCECGRIGDPAGVVRAAELVDACLHAAEIPDHPVAEADLHVFHSVATLKVRPGFSLSFEELDSDIIFRSDLDTLNFRQLEPGEIIGRVRPTATNVLEAIDEHDVVVTDQFLQQRGEWISVSKTTVPAMLTRDERIVRQDCLGYLMERFPR